MKRWLSLSSLILFVALASCGRQPTGTVTVDITGLPAGLDAAVSLTGARGTTEISRDTVLTLPVGSYDISVDTVREDRTYVDREYDGGSGLESLLVTENGDETLTITYGPRPGTGTLWVPEFGSGDIKGFAYNQLGSGGALEPEYQLAIAHDWEAAAVTDDGNLWVTSFNGRLIGLTAEQLANEDTEPSVDIVNDGAGTPFIVAGSLAFDDEGNLWVSDYSQHRIVRLAAEQLQESGSPSPDVIIDSNGSSLQAPTGLAFDSDGNLWVGSLSAGRIDMYSPAQLEAGGSPTPERTIVDNGSNLLDGVFDLVFDSDGNLWVSTFTTSYLLMYSGPLLEAGGNPDPTVLLGGMAFAGMAFDEGGNLWVVDRDEDSLSMLPAVDLDTSGTASPVTTITGFTALDFGKPAFNPPPLALPLHR